MPRQLPLAIEARFPTLRATGYTTESDPTAKYNCIAWAVGRTDRWWWPVPSFYHWPSGVARLETIGAFIAAFQQEGFVECGDGTLESGQEKVVIYTRLDGKPTHAARQLVNGKWASKLGTAHDIHHNDPQGLTGQEYGIPAVFMKRPAETRMQGKIVKKKKPAHSS